MLTPYSSSTGQTGISGKHFPPFLPARIISGDEAGSLAARERRNLVEQHRRLRELVQWHGKTIAARLSKRTREKRKALFLSINAFLKPTRPDVFAHHVNSRPSSLLQTLNLDDLAHGNHFVSLLTTRALYSLSDWALFDNEAGTASREFACVDGVVRIFGPEEGYGEYLPAHGRQFGASENEGEVLPFGHGIQLMERQSELLAFLAAVIEELLQDIDVSLSPPIHQSLTKNDIIRTDTLPLAEQWHLRTYSLPPAFCIESVMQSLLARVSAAADDVWLLRTDPVHFRMRMQHNATKRRGPPGKDDRDTFWNDVCRSLVLDAYRSLLTWTSAFEVAHDLQRALTDHSNGDPGEISRDLRFQMACLTLVLEGILAHALRSLSGVAHPGRSARTDLKTGKLLQDAGMLDIVASLLYHGTDGSLSEREHILLAFDDLFHRDTGQRAPLGNDHINALSHISTANSVLGHLRYNRPPPATLSSDQRSRQYLRFFGRCAEIQMIWSSGNIVKTCDLTRSCQNFDTVSSSVSHRAGQAANTMLRAVWNRVDDFFASSTLGRSLLDLTRGSVGFRETRDATLQPDHDHFFPFTTTLLLSAKKRTLSFFNFLFSETDDDSELNWTFNDFKIGMRQLGFQVEHVIASEYRFTPASDSCFPEFPLSVYEPSPYGHFTWIDRRCLAKRLNQHYGLSERYFAIGNKLNSKRHSRQSSATISTTEGI